jgi:hypothetical protein
MKDPRRPIAHVLTRFIKLVVATSLIMMFASDTSYAKECRWFGTAPLCDGECPRGWSLEQLSGKGCAGTWGISGTKAFCCKIERACGPKQWGTEGCPYPSFQGRRGKSKRLEPPPLSDAPDPPETRTDKPLPSGERQCPPGYRVLSSPNKYGAYCEQIPTTSGCPPGLAGPNCDQVIVK